MSGFCWRFQKLSTERPEVLNSWTVGLGQYACTEWDLIPRWWQWGFGFGKERVTDPRGCYDGAYPYWWFEIMAEFGKYRILPPIRVEFYRYGEPDEDGISEKTYEFVWPPWEWQIDFPKWLDNLVYWWYHRK